MTKKKKKSRIYIIWLMNLCLITTVVAIFVWYESVPDVSPEKVLKTYMAHISNREYEQMYEMIDAGISGNISQEDFVKRNSAIYEGIDVDNMKVHITSYDKEQKEICYETSMDTVAGNVTFENKASFILEKGKYKLIWNDSLIFPELDSTDKVKVSTTSAKRGQIIDRNGHLLAGEGVASSIGVVPGELENKNDAISQLAELLEMKTEDIEKKLAAKWVKDDSFVPLKTVPKVNELKLMSIEPDQETLAEKDRQEKLLEIPGVKISDITVREYPLGEAAAHLVGYVQNVTAEDLEEHAGEGYTSNSVIGKSGMEGLFEKELKGQNGCAISIVDSNGNKKKIVVSTIVENGKDIKLTIDSDLQKELYEQYKDDKSCTVAMNQYTGEVLALSSTPSYDNNDFIMGMSNEKWTALNEDERKPMYNRFRQVWCPGSTFKPNEKFPYVADDNLGIGAVYHIPKTEFENVIMEYFNIDSDKLQKKTIYDYQTQTYEYKPRGFYEIEYPEYPYSEVVGYKEHSDGTITLNVHVIYPYAGNSNVYMHDVTVRPLSDGGFQYVSNYIVSEEENNNITWHTPRLTEDEWNDIYGGQ